MHSIFSSSGKIIRAGFAWLLLLSCAGVTQVHSQQISKAELLGKFDPAAHADFVVIENKWTDKPNIYLRIKAYQSFVSMAEAAAKDGVKLTIVSATRNFNYQKGIWEKKWKREKYADWSAAQKVTDILQYSSMPGTSRHHWGTDVDFNSVDPAYFENTSGKQVYQWLLKNASTYGYHQTYTSKAAGRTGFEEEKWHWSYMPLSSSFLAQYNATIHYADISDFSGSEAAAEAKVIEWFVNGIEPSLIK